MTMSNTGNKETSQELEEEINVDQAAVAEQEEAPEANASEPTVESLQAELEAQQAQFTDQLLRTKAEMENVRRRSEKQISDSRKFANDGIARELVNVRDSLQIASETEIEAQDSDAVKSMREGLELTLKQLDSLFEKFSITEIAPVAGDKLDPNLHQAMTMVPSDEVEPGSVVNTIQRGYQLHDRLLRPAMVVVAQK
ncbi:MAG: nucleotide exchange factor GrpE [Arenicella sp.]